MKHGAGESARVRVLQGGMKAGNDLQAVGECRFCSVGKNVGGPR